MATYPTMEIYKQDQRSVLDFHVNLSSRVVLEQLGFIFLVEMKFNADRGNVLRFWQAHRKPFASVELVLPDYRSLSDAYSHCRTNLTPAGKVLARYRGALDYADRGGYGAAALMEEISEAAFSN